MSALLKNLGPFSNRVVMSAMTRTRSDAEGVLKPIVSEYYAQRASAGLILTEGVATSAAGKGYAFTPGIYTDAQENAWREVAEKVHRTNKDAKIFMQLMHTGRIGSKANTGTEEIYAPSSVHAEGEIYTANGKANHDVPVELTKEQIHQIIGEYAAATKRALAAGLDGVELHAANGYLPHQFLSSNVNVRNDEYGRDHTLFVEEVLKAMIAAADGDASKVGIKISPANPFNGIVENNTNALYEALTKRLGHLSLRFVEILTMPTTRFYIDIVRKNYSGIIIANCSFDQKSGEEAILSNMADMISYGQLYIANPDLVERFAANEDPKHYNPPKKDLFYGSGPEGYTDYPTSSTRAHAN